MKGMTYDEYLDFKEAEEHEVWVSENKEEFEEIVRFELPNGYSTDVKYYGTRVWYGRNWDYVEVFYDHEYGENYLNGEIYCDILDDDQEIDLKKKIMEYSSKKYGLNPRY